MRLVVSVLGVPVTVETNSAEVLAVTRSMYEAATYPQLDAAVRDLTVRVVTTDDAGDEPLAAPLVRLPDPNRLVLELIDGNARADSVSGEAIAHVPRRVVRAAGFREWILDHLILFLVTRADRVPVHAGAIARDGRALLLAGPSGLGKSTLTYAAMRDGCQVVADDAVYLQRSPARCLWGLPRRIHLPRESARFFPELASVPDTLRGDGRRKIAVDIPAAARARSPWTGDVGLCLLTRAVSGDRPQRITADTAVDEMRATLQGGFERFSDTLDECVGALIAGGCWRLPITAEPGALVRRLDELFAAA